jgi:hypothetical protein
MRAMRSIVRLGLVIGCLFAAGVSAQAGLPFSTVFVGEERFHALVRRAEAEGWASLPLGERTGAIGRALVGTPYKNFTLEIDDRIEAASVNMRAMDCWTFFEIALGFSRMLAEPREAWTPRGLLAQVEKDRYRGGHCDGTYLSRLHYLEEWWADNARRGLVTDVTRSLGGVKVPHSAVEMTVNWKSYRYLRANPELREGIRQMEARVTRLGLYHVPKARVRAIEGKLRTGDVIGITTHDGPRYGTSHVGLAYRTQDGVLRFMHASAPRNFGKVVLDSRLSEYLNRYRSNAGIMVARPIR